MDLNDAATCVECGLVTTECTCPVILSRHAPPKEVLQGIEEATQNLGREVTDHELGTSQSSVHMNGGSVKPPTGIAKNLLQWADHVQRHPFRYDTGRLDALAGDLRRAAEEIEQLKKETLYLQSLVFEGPEVTAEMVERAVRALRQAWGRDEPLTAITKEDIEMILRAALQETP